MAKLAAIILGLATALLFLGGATIYAAVTGALFLMILTAIAFDNEGRVELD